MQKFANFIGKISQDIQTQFPNLRWLLVKNSQLSVNKHIFYI